jgi:rRNA-processing protein FCF1
MQSIVIDESIALGLCFEDQIDATVLLSIEALRSSTAIVSPLWHSQVAETLLAAEHRKRILAPDTQKFLDLLKAIRPEVDTEATTHLWDKTLQLAREHGISHSAACTLEIAHRRHAAIATKDKELQRAARKCGVALVE